MTNKSSAVIKGDMKRDEIQNYLPCSVELLCLTNGAPLLLQGTLKQNDENELLMFASISSFPIRLDGFHAIINFKNDDIPMFTLTIKQQQDTELMLEFSHVHPREKRLFPRMYAQMSMLIQEVKTDFAVSKWLNNEISSDPTWVQPEPFMNFSINGVSFQSKLPLTKSSTVLVELELDEVYRIVARVIRCQLEGDRYDIALYFEEISEKAIKYLSSMTLRIQDALL
jgi:hypothetical protein